MFQLSSGGAAAQADTGQEIGCIIMFQLLQPPLPSDNIASKHCTHWRFWGRVSYDSDKDWKSVDENFIWIYSASQYPATKGQKCQCQQPLRAQNHFYPHSLSVSSTTVSRLPPHQKMCPTLLLPKWPGQCTVGQISHFCPISSKYLSTVRPLCNVCAGISVHE